MWGLSADAGAVGGGRNVFARSQALASDGDGDAWSRLDMWPSMKASQLMSLAHLWGRPRRGTRVSCAIIAEFKSTNMARRRVCRRVCGRHPSFALKILAKWTDCAASTEKRFLLADHDLGLVEHADEELLHAEVEERELGVGFFLCLVGFCAASFARMRLAMVV